MTSKIELMEFAKLIANAPHPERMSGGHLTNDARAALAFATITNYQAKAKALLEGEPFDIGAYIDAHTD